MQWQIILAFFEGLALILSPCILPILPIILSTSLAGSRKRPLGIIVGFILTFAIVTFFARQLVQQTGISLEWLRNISYAVLLLFGVVMLSTYLTDKFNLWANRLTAFGSTIKVANDPEAGFKGGIFLGALIGVIWTPCAGPILAAVIVQSVLQQTSLSSFFIVLAFSVGAAVPMLLIAWFGRTMMSKFQFFKKHTIAVRKLLGFIIILSVGFMLYAEKYSVILPGVRESDIIHENKLIQAIEYPYTMPAIENVTAWFNSKPLIPEDLKGKVVLVDFWTYSCINCIRTLPYLKEWYAKYHDKGLVIIGVHAPEFEFEKNNDNVREAVKKFGISYPVAMDNDFTTWRNFSNRYWPAHYLVDKSGNVVYEHFGEGEYDVTENNIRFLLGLNSMPAKSAQAIDFINQTPETYLGTARAENLQDGYPPHLDVNDWALRGKWLRTLDKVTSREENDAVKIHFHASKVFMVMGSGTGFPVTVKVLLDGKPINSIRVAEHRLYEVLVFDKTMDGILEVIAMGPGLEVYTYTFG